MTAAVATERREWQIGLVPPRIARLLRRLEVPLIGCAVLVRFVIGIGGAPFHVDESQWIATSNALDAFVSGDWHSPVWDESYWTLNQPPLTRYVIGLGRRAAGYRVTDLNRPWKFSKDEATNLAEGAMPSADLLFWSRLPMAVLSALAATLLFVLVTQSAGRVAGYAFVVLFAGNAYLLLQLRRAMSEAPLLAFVTLSAFATHRVLARAWPLRRGTIRGAVVWGALAAMFAGMAGAAKLNGLLVAGGAGLLPAIAIWHSSAPSSGRVIGFWGSVLLAAAIAGAVFVLLNPYLYPDPIGRTLKMVAYRQFEMRNQLALFSQYQFPDAHARLATIAQRIFRDDAFFTFAGAGMLNVLLCAVGGAHLVRSTWHWLRTAGGGGSAVLVVTALTAGSPGLLTPLDWDRYYLLPVVFTTVCIAIGLGRGIAWLIRMRRVC